MFTSFTLIPLGEDGCPADLLRFPSLNYRKNCEKGGEGTVMETADLPPGMSYEKCKVWATNQRGFNQVLLRPEDIHRQPPGLDRYTLACRQMVAARPSSITGLPLSAPTFTDLREKSKRIQREKELLNLAQLQGGAAATGEMTYTSRSSLIDLGGMAVAKVSKEQKEG